MIKKPDDDGRAMAFLRQLGNRKEPSPKEREAGQRFIFGRGTLKDYLDAKT